MRGEVLHYDETHGFGFITGEDGNRYTFRREDLRRPFPLSKGVAIEFRDSGDQARDVSLPGVASQASAQPAAATPPKPAALTATPIAIPTTRPAQQRYGRNAADNGAAGREGSTGLWSYFWAGITTNYANFSGRARRKEYWGFVLFYSLGMVLLVIAGLAVDAATGNLDYNADFPIPATVVIVLLAMLASLIPGIAISVRRFHDIGMSGWFYLMMFVVGFVLTGSLVILAIVLGLIPSQRRENKWGPLPDGVDAPLRAA